MRLIQRLAITGLLSVVVIVLLTGTFVARRDSLIGGNDELTDQLNTAWVQENDFTEQNHVKEDVKEKQIVVNPRDRSHRVPPSKPIGPEKYQINEPKPPLDSLTNQRRDKIKEVCLLILILIYTLCMVKKILLYFLIIKKKGKYGV